MFPEQKTEIKGLFSASRALTWNESQDKGEEVIRLW
jgi:hypothetical protein